MGKKRKNWQHLLAKRLRPKTAAEKRQKTALLCTKTDAPELKTSQNRWPNCSQITPIRDETWPAASRNATSTLHTQKQPQTSKQTKLSKTITYRVNPSDSICFWGGDLEFFCVVKIGRILWYVLRSHDLWYLTPSWSCVWSRFWLTGCNNKEESGLWGFFLFTGVKEFLFFQNYATSHPQCIPNASKNFFLNNWRKSYTFELCIWEYQC